MPYPRKSRRGARLLGMVSCLVALAFAATPASAYVLWIGGYLSTVPLVPIYLVTCNDGFTIILEPGFDLPSAMTYAQNVACANHGGVADVTDDSVTAALEAVGNPSGPSDVSLGLDLGGGQYQPLTPQELIAIAQSAPPGGTPLQGYEVLSMRVYGVELRSNAQVLPTTIPLRAIYSDEEDDGGAVGAVIAPNVPLGGGGALGLGALAVGVCSIHRRRRSVE